MDFTRKVVIRPQLQKFDSETSSEELPPKHIRLQTNNKLLQQTHLIRASTSGLGSSENYSIETPISSVHNSPTKNALGLPSKRTLQTCGPIVHKKRIKLDNNDNLAENKKNSINETGVAILQDTLDNLDISVILKQSASKNSSDQLNKSEFDAFANFLNKGTSSSNEKINRQLFVGCGIQPTSSDEDIFSQSFNTQIINQLDVAITHELSKSTIESEDDNDNNSKNETECFDKIKEKDDNFKIPVLKPFSDKIATSKVRKCQDRSLLFNDDSVTRVYKKEVDQLFEQIEQSICEMGNENMNKNIPDKILDVFFADNKIKNPSNRDIDRTIQQLNDDSFPNEPNCSLGTAIKQALLNNATKGVHSQNEGINPDSTLNRSLPEVPLEFYKLGSFYDLPDKVRDLIKQFKGIDTLYEWQEECLNLAIVNRKNLIYALPTSGGKTLVAEILMLREILCYKRNAIFILPYVAIVQEKVWDLSPFGVALDFLVEEYASSKGTYPPRKRRRKHSVYIATIEKALGLVNSLIETGRLNEIGLIVIDELHLIGEEGRGATLEACLTKLMFLNGNVQIVGMSATIGNIQDICKFLNAEVYTKNFRPVELTEYVKCDNEIARVNWKCKDENDLLVDIKTLDYKYSEAVAKLDPDMLGGLVLQVIPKGSCLVFCASKNNCENVVHLLCRLTKPYLKDYKKNEKDQLLQALKEETGELCQTLKVSVPFGIAYHHSGLTGEERRLLEDAFRAGTISVICCTSTLAAGVNLPARRVILRSPYIGKEFINLSRYKQMAGRAGRAGFGELGESIIVTSKIDLPKVKALLLSPMNQANSSLHTSEGRGLRHLLLSCISLGIANTRVQLQKVSQSTLMAVQVHKLDVDVKRLTDSVIKNLFKLGALQESCDKGNQRSIESQCNVSIKMETSLASLTNSELETSMNDSASTSSSKKTKKTLTLTSNTKLVVSNLGTAAIKGGLDLSRAHQLYDDLYQAQKSLVLLNCLHLLYLVTPYETAEHVKPNIHVYYDVLTHLNEKESQTAKILGFDEAVTIKMAIGQTAKQIPEKVLNRFYVTLMLYDLWNEMPVFKVSEKYQINRGIVQNLMLISSTFASNVVNFCDQLEEFWAFAHLLKGMSQRLSHCCIRELVPLMELPAVKQSRAKQLYNAGYKNLQSIAKAKADDLVENIEFMSRRTACQLIAASKMLLLEKVENLREEAEDVLDGVEDPRQLLNVSVVPFK